jgi:uncharacterized protein (DUF2336 family)
MTAIASTDLIAAEIEAAVTGGSVESRARILRQVTHLLIANSHRLGSRQLDMFDDILLRLMNGVDTDALARLADAISDLPDTPKQTARRLARHAEPAVAIPVLLRCETLSDYELAAIAIDCGKQHALAMCSRLAPKENLTDALVRRRDIEICRALARNPGAGFSESSLSKLACLAEHDRDLVELLALRPDTSPALLAKLLSNADDPLRLRLLATAPPKLRRKIRTALDHAGSQICAKMPESAVYAEARANVATLSKAGKLNDSTVNRFAVRREYTNLVAALSLLSGAAIETIEALIEEDGWEDLVVACRASRLLWPTTLAIISSRNVRSPSIKDLERAKEQFEKLYLSNAQWMIRSGTSLRSSAQSQ